MFPTKDRILAIIVLLLGFLALSKGMKAQNVVLKDNVFIQQNSVGDSITTKYYYQDTTGMKYPIFISAKGKAYCWVKSKSGKMYRKYLPKVTQELNRKNHERN